MSTAIWGEQEDEIYPSSLLKQLLYQMMMQFGAHGACLAWYDSHKGQMIVRQHVRLRNAVTHALRANVEAENLPPLARRTTINLSTDPALPAYGRFKLPSQLAELLEDVSPQQSDIFPAGARYSLGDDLIGYAWQKDTSYIIPHDDYLVSFHPGISVPLRSDVLPTWYLVAPIRESPFIDEMQGVGATLAVALQPAVKGIIVLYQTLHGTGFQQKQRREALQFTERITLYLENERLHRVQKRTNDYIQQLMKISTTFPTTVTLADLVKEAYQFTSKVVDVSSMLVTLYDRDRHKIYDVYANRLGNNIAGLPAKPVSPEDRPLWWQITQEEKRTLVFTPYQDYSLYEELLEGVWGDQREAGSFLLLPMKIFNRVIGSLCITSLKPDAYQPEEIQILETMVQIITVGIENVRLYERARTSLQEAKQREELLAAMNSALQSISSVLNSAELLYKFVESVARLLRSEMCVFFQLSPMGENFVSQSVYAKESIPLQDGNEHFLSNLIHNKNEHTDLIGQMELRYKDSSLEQLVNEAFFYLEPHMIEDLARQSPDSGAIYLLETNSQRFLMLPVRYQTELIGLLSVHVTQQNQKLRPNEVGMLLALCAQAASAIRNAEAYTELERMDKLKDEFLVTASHEFRTPLSAVSGYASLLKRQSGRINPQQIMRFATKIAGATQQLSDLVANMTDAAKLGGVDKKLDLQIGLVEIRAAVEMAASMLSVNIEQKITPYIEPDLWVTGDPLRVRQVISNLLDNAAKYSRPDSSITIVATATTLSQLPLKQEDPSLLFNSNGDKPVILISVIDEGEGIHPQDQQKIFEKFVRAARSLTTPIRGSGLGLYICRRYIEAMGGKIWLAKSDPNKGSIFSFYLPRVNSPIGTEEQDESTTKTR